MFSSQGFDVEAMKEDSTEVSALGLWIVQPMFSLLGSRSEALGLEWDIFPSTTSTAIRSSEVGWHNPETGRGRDGDSIIWRIVRSWDGLYS